MRSPDSPCGWEVKSECTINILADFGANVSRSSYVNGQAIIVDGGLSSSLPVVPGKNY